MSAGPINQLVTDAALAQLDTLLTKVGQADQKLIDATASANKFNDAIGNVKTLTDFTTATQTAIQAMQGMVAANQSVIDTNKQVQVETARVVEGIKAKIEAEAASKRSTVEFTAETTAAITRQVQLRAELNQTNTALKNLAQFNNLGKTAASQLSQETEKLTQRQAELKIQLQQNNALVNQTVKESLAAGGSYDEMSARLNRLRTVYKGLSEEQAKGQQGSTLLNEINSLDKSLKEQDAAMGVTTRNVGNYKSALAGASQALQAFGIYMGVFQLVQWGKDLFNIAVIASGVDRAFTALARPDLLPKLREQTRGLIDDLDLEKASVKIRNFGIDVDKLGPILEFAAERAEDTGKSIEDVVTSITDGLGKGTRSVTMIAQALGVGVTELREALKKTGDLAGAVTYVVQKDLDDTGTHVDTLADKANKLSVIFSNLGKRISAAFFASPTDPDDGVIAKLTKQDEDRLDISHRSDAFIKQSLTDQITLVKLLSGAKSQADKEAHNALGFGTTKGETSEQAYASAKSTNEKLVAAQNVLKALKAENTLRQENLRLAGDEVSVDEMQAKVTQLNNQAKAIVPGVSIGENGKVQTNADVQNILQQAKDLQEKINDILGVSNKKRDDQYNKDYDKTVREKLENERQDLIDQKKAAELSLNDKKLTYDARLVAIQQYIEKANALIDKEKDIADTERDISPTKRNTNAKIATGQKEDVKIFGQDQTAKLQKEAEDELKKALEDGLKDQEAILQQEIIDFKDAQDQKLLQIDKFKSNSLKAQADLYRDGKISAAQYNQAVYDIEADAAKKRVNVQIDALQKIIDKQKDDQQFGIGNPKDIQKNQDTLDSLKIKASDLDTKVELDNIAKLETAKKNLADLEKQLANQSIDLIKTLVDQGYQKQLDSLKQQALQVNQNAENEKNAVNGSILSSKEKARENAVIDQAAANAQLQITNEQNRIKTKEAEFDKLVSIAKITSATAIAEVQALSYLSNPFTAPLYPAIATTIAALGALELATALATPIPKFQGGGTMTKSGYMITGEAGPELRIDPSGKTSFTAPYANITYAEAGTKIISNHELVKIMGKPDQVQIVNSQATDNRKIEKLLAENNDLQRKNAQQRPINNIRLNDDWGYYKHNYLR